MTASFPDTRLAAFARLDDDESRALSELLTGAESLPAGRIIRAQGSAEPALYVLQRGWVASTLHLANGACQFVKIHLPGDIMGAPSLPYATAVDSLLTLTTAEFSQVSLDGLGELFAAHPRLATLFLLGLQQEQVFLMDRLASIGRTEAPARIAAFLLHLQERFAAQLGVISRRIDVPLTQQQLGDVLGLSEIHVNRVLQQMERDQLIRRDKRQFEILKVDALRSLAGAPRRKLRSRYDWLPAAREMMSDDDGGVQEPDTRATVAKTIRA